MNDIPSLPSPHHFGQMMVRARGYSLRRQVLQGYRFLEAPHAHFHLALWAPEHGGGTRKGAWNSGCLGWPLFHCEQICDSKGYWPMGGPCCQFHRAAWRGRKSICWPWSWGSLTFVLALPCWANRFFSRTQFPSL